MSRRKWKGIVYYYEYHFSLHHGIEAVNRNPSRSRPAKLTFSSGTDMSQAMAQTSLVDRARVHAAGTVAPFIMRLTRQCPSGISFFEFDEERREIQDSR